MVAEMAPGLLGTLRLLSDANISAKKEIVSRLHNGNDIRKCQGGNCVLPKCRNCIMKY